MGMITTASAASVPLPLPLPLPPFFQGGALPPLPSLRENCPYEAPPPLPVKGQGQGQEQGHRSLRSRVVPGPALIGLLPKTKSYPSRIDAAIRKCVPMMRHADGVLPVVLNDRPVAFLRGHGWRSPDVDVAIIKRWGALGNYQNILDALVAGRKFGVQWGKAQGTSYPTALSWYDLWPVLGVPIAGTYAAAGALTATQYDNSSVGAMNLGPTPGSGQAKHIVYGGYSNSLQTGSALVYDRVLTYEQCPVASSLQSMTNVAVAARWAGDGQRGLRIIPTIQALTGAVASDWSSLTYVDQDGNPGIAMPVTQAQRIVVNTPTPTSSLPALVTTSNTVGPATSQSWHLPLATADSGVRSVTSYQHSADNTGSLCLVLAWPLALVPNQSITPGATHDYTTQWPWMGRMYDNACVSFLAYSPSVASPMHQGHLSFIWG